MPENQMTSARIIGANFIGSFETMDQLPHDAVPEIVFLGRSNAGKSSLLNTTVNRRALARTSKAPGRTRLINLFQIKFADDRNVRFVDLPGYGYAKISKRERAAWDESLGEYLTSRANIRLTLLLIDCRRHLEEEEQLVFRTSRVPVILVLTKSDKLSRSEFERRERELAQETKSEYIATSASDANDPGIERMRQRIYEHAFR